MQGVLHLARREEENQLTRKQGSDPRLENKAKLGSLQGSSVQLRSGWCNTVGKQKVWAEGGGRYQKVEERQPM